MDLENMEDVDLEEQRPPPPPPPPPPSPSPPPPSPLQPLPLLLRPPRKPGGAERAALAAPARALALVVLMAGLLLSIHLLTHGDLATFVLLVAEFVCIFLVLSCAAPRHGLLGVAAVVEVAVWAFAMALTVTMTSWVASALPLAAVVVLHLLSLLVVAACFAVLLDA